MTEELYLIAHKVRGEAAFDVAIKMVCPECHGQTCPECDDGFFWIIPTSGHRAYPYKHINLAGLYQGDDKISVFEQFEYHWEMPSDLPDHYLHAPSPKLDIRALFQKGKAQAKAFMQRRF